MANKKNKKSVTSRSSLGVPGRIYQDTSKSYSSHHYEDLDKEKIIKYIENKIDKKYLNQIICKSSESMEELPDNSIHLMITSPPYDLIKQNDFEFTIEEYRQILRNVWKETYRVLVPGGRACIIIANLGKKPYIPLHAYIVEDMQELGFLMRGEIIWNKASRTSPSKSEGSWLSAANPVLRDIHEYILIYSKNTFSRSSKGKKNTIKKEEYLEWSKSVWTFPAVSAKQIGHPAPFPEELPHRLIQLYTFENDIVLDPFSGSGATCISALRDKRRYLGYDINSSYVQLAQKRISVVKNQMYIFD